MPPHDKDRRGLVGSHWSPPSSHCYLCATGVPVLCGLTSPSRSCMNRLHDVIMVKPHTSFTNDSFLIHPWGPVDFINFWSGTCLCPFARNSTSDRSTLVIQLWLPKLVYTALISRCLLLPSYLPPLVPTSYGLQPSFQILSPVLPFLSRWALLPQRICAPTTASSAYTFVVSFSAARRPT